MYACMLVNIAMNNHVIAVLTEPICSGCVSPALWMDEWNKLQDFRWGNSSCGSGEEELEEVQETIASIQLVSSTGRSAVVRIECITMITRCSGISYHKHTMVSL